MNRVGIGDPSVTAALLKEAGFMVSKQCSSRPSCFDFAARRNDELLLVKVQADIDNVSMGDSLELKAISKCISAVYLLISMKAREKPLEDDTVYSRYALFAVTPKTFESIMLHNVFPLIQAGPGGCYVEIDCDAIRRRRQELGMSIGDMAKKIGISRRTLYGYEHGMAKASVATAYNLVYTLGIPVARPVNIFEKAKHQHKRCFLTKAKLAIAKNSLLSKVFRKFARYPITVVRKAPFDFVLSIPEEEVKIVGGVADSKEGTLDRRVDEILSVSTVI
ncbi:helix-turn-helix domain-containing protein [Candidatus Bathyarchaeota archaeon]|nr:helix-turn-helix domain-containing protein [Candidatus Bathyarchaeota archaeon]